ncbi:hypothetical protein ACFX1Q_033374 [Malus domestica]
MVGARVTFLANGLYGWRKDEIDVGRGGNNRLSSPATMVAAHPIASASAFFEAAIMMTSSCELYCETECRLRELI